MQVGAHLADEELPAALACVQHAGLFDLGSYGVDDAVPVVGGVEVGDVAGGEEIVEVHEHPLVDDLLIGEEPDDGGALEPCNGNVTAM